MSGVLLQQLVVAGIVLAAAAWLARRAWRTIAAARGPKEPGCGSGCGCGK